MKKEIIKRTILNGVTILSAEPIPEVRRIKKEYFLYYIKKRKQWIASIKVDDEVHFLCRKAKKEEAEKVIAAALKAKEKGKFQEWLIEYRTRKNKYTVRGLSYRESAGLYYLKVTYNEKGYHIGTYKTIEEGAIAREEVDKHIEDGTFIEWLMALRESRKKKK